mmetsp:Transcript_69244/g.192827  ORF Transcript_69244/g.192827 Transcript_69244/m.192827 type:complete len:203 (-) Transcript_69244:242-850(-)
MGDVKDVGKRCCYPGVTTVAISLTAAGATAAVVIAWRRHKRAARKMSRAFDAADGDGDIISAIHCEPFEAVRWSPPRATEHGPSHVVDHILDDSLRALGMLSGPQDAGSAAAAAAAATARARRSAAMQHHQAQGGTEDADDTVVVERVSPEEEERRYFANLAGGDILGLDGLGGFDEFLPAETPGKTGQKPTRQLISYDETG